MRIIATVTDRTDLLLYDLYQRLTLSLPRGGFNYQFAHSVPPGTSFRPSPGEEQLSDYAQRIVRLVQDVNRSGKVILADAASGLTAPLRQCFQQLLALGHKCLWIELEDFADTLSLAHQIFVLMALRLGRFSLELDQFVPTAKSVEVEDKDWADHIARLLRHWNVDPSEWVIVLYGRNGPGGCAGWREQYWDQAEYQRFERLLLALVQVNADKRERKGELRDGTNLGSGFTVIYAPYTEVRSKRDKARQEALDQLNVSVTPAIPQEWGYSDWQKSDLASRNRIDQIAPHDLQESRRPDATELYERLDPLPDPPETSFEDNMDYVQNDWLLPVALRGRGEQSTALSIPEARFKEALDARRFLYGSVLFRQSRHFSALLSEAVYPCPRRYNLAGEDSDWIRHQRVFKWLVKLNQRGHIIFAKPGGFAWMYRDSRLGVQYLAERLGPDDLLPQYWFAAQGRSRMHFWIGDWYGRAYRATGHVLPLLESIFHYAECLRYVPWAKPSRLKKEEVQAAITYRRTLARRSITELTKTLRMGRDSTICFWLQDAAGDSWFSLREATNSVPEGGGRRLLRDLEDVFLKLEKQELSSTALGQPATSFPWRRWLRELDAEFRQLPQLDNDRIPPVFATAQVSKEESEEGRPRPTEIPFCRAGIDRSDVYHS
ncbi:MAG TPA: hypothetical protein VGO11_21595, partial [Chthoniobacteraceae bacterium]|nr:hypothetical protein [Chthoniobacteraceae bacterium]